MNQNFEIEGLNLTLPEFSRHIANLKLICESTKVLPEGSILYKHNSYEVDMENINKQKNLSILSRKCSSILEIGFNTGHSALLMLVSNPNCRLHCIDICTHPYVKHCFSYMKINFGDRITLFEGDSHSGLEDLKKKGETFDMTHIDGSKDFCVINIDYFLSRNITKKYIVMDDTNMPHIEYLWNGYIRDRHFDDMLRGKSELFPTNRHGIAKLFSCDLKICVASLALGEKYKKIVKYGTKTKEEYCKRHFYDFCNDESVYDTSRPYAWSKIRLIQKCMESNERSQGKDSQMYDYIVWMDADTFVMNPEKKLEVFISDLSQGRDILIAQDWHMINSGVMFIKNSEWSRKFLDALWDKTEFLNDNNWEQTAIIDMYDKNILDCKNHITVLPMDRQREINAYYCNFKLGDFLIHLAGCFREDNDHGLAEMMNRVCPMKMDEESDAEYEIRQSIVHMVFDENR